MMMIKLIITVMALKRTLVVATMSITNLMFSSSSGANPVLQQVGGVVRGSRWLWHCGMGTFHHSHPSHSRCQNMSKLPKRWLWLCGMDRFHHSNYLSHPRHCSCQISMAIAILITTNKNLSAKVIVHVLTKKLKGAVELRDSCEQPGKAQLVRKLFMQINQIK